MRVTLLPARMAHQLSGLPAVPPGAGHRDAQVTDQLTADGGVPAGYLLLPGQRLHPLHELVLLAMGKGMQGLRYTHGCKLPLRRLICLGRRLVSDVAPRPAPLPGRDVMPLGLVRRHAKPSYRDRVNLNTVSWAFRCS